MLMCVQIFGPVVVFDVADGDEIQSTNWSLENGAEASVVLQLYSTLTQHYPDLRQDRGRIGIISPYKAQVGGLTISCATSLDANQHGGESGSWHGLSPGPCVWGHVRLPFDYLQPLMPDCRLPI